MTNVRLPDALRLSGVYPRIALYLLDCLMRYAYQAYPRIALYLLDCLMRYAYQAYLRIALYRICTIM